MRRRKEDFIVLGLALVLVLIILGIAYAMFSQSQPQITQRQPGVAPTSIPTATPTPTPTQLGNEDSLARQPNRVLYDIETEKKLLDKLKNRQPLSTEDSQAKAKILATLPFGQKSGGLYESENVFIEYIEPVDEFQTTIFSLDVARAKTEAVAWFLTRGMSQKGICDLPLNFLPGGDLIDHLKSTREVFYSLPSGCE